MHSKMKVLTLPAYAYPEEVASSHLARDRNEALVANDMLIDIVAPSPCRGLSDEDYKKYKVIPHESLSDGKINIYRFQMYREGKNPLFRALRYCFCWIKQLRAAYQRDYDVLLIGSTPPIQGMIGAIAARRRKKPFVYMLQDIFPDSLVGTGLAKKDGLLWKIGRLIENFTYKNADKIIVISQDFKRNIMAKGVSEEKIEVIYNWVDAEAVRPVAKDENPLYEEFGLRRDIFTVVYAGNLGNAQNIDIVLDAAERLPEVQFALFGTGGREAEIRERIVAEQFGNVHLNPLQPYGRVSQVYGLGDVCVVSCKPGLGGAAMPSKTWSIMSSGSAVLASFDEGELKDIIEKGPYGVFTHAGNVQEFVSTIRSLAADRERCWEMGRNARRFIEGNLTKEVGTGKYVETIKSVVGKRYC